MEEKLPVEIQPSSKALIHIETSDLPPEDKEIFSSLFQLLAAGLKRDEVYSKLVELAKKNPSLFDSPWQYDPNRRLFEDTRSLRNALEEDFFDPNVGIVREGDVFVTTRDGWVKGLDAPRVRGAYKEGQAQIEISPNLDPETHFHSGVLPGLDSIVLKQNGEIIGILSSRKKRELNSQEKTKLVGLLNGLRAKVERVLQANYGKYINLTKRGEDRNSVTAKDK